MVRCGLGLPLAALFAHAIAPVTASLAMASLPARRVDTCPDVCRERGSNPANWTVVAEFAQLGACSHPIVLDFSLDIPTSDKQFIRACDTWGESYYYTPPPQIETTPGEEKERVLPQLAWSGRKKGAHLKALMALKEIKAHLQGGTAWNKTVLFGAFGGATVGVYIGNGMLGPSAATVLIDPLLAKIEAVGIRKSKAAMLQVCGQNRTSSLTFGVIAAADKDFATVQAAVKSWSQSDCVNTTTYAETSTLETIPVRVKYLVSALPLSNSTGNFTLGSNSTTLASRLRRRATNLLIPRADCEVIKTEEGDGCGSLLAKAQKSSKCSKDMTLKDFEKYNPDPNLCSTLKVGQRICCTAGSLPDITPKQNSDGSCKSYTTQADDSCWKIAVANGITPQILEAVNKDTWGWAGCDTLWVGTTMCLSKGTPPMPAPISNAVCGPQKPGTITPPKGTNISELNPCPLHVCCNIWGQCGTSDDFCVNTRGSGPPGTAKKGTYGCISNCGNDIIQSAPPAQFIKLGYFEAFNLGRECLNMDVSQIDKSYTHVHFAFGMIKDDFTIYMEDEYQKYQWEQFKKLRGPKRILSFGGWTFSAERPYYTIFRNGVKTANRDKLASNIAKFVNDAGIDGVDIDWEYPGAPNIPGIPPPDDPNEAQLYAAFLKILRGKLDQGKTLSIAAPASYWYLKAFPIAGMAKILDYIVFMTYDLHGQWDATNKWANPGCIEGNCLRSQVNITETLGALAGVPSNKVLVGVTSYGRSFQMSDPNCAGPDCFFTGGPELGGSNARKGRCTGTAGYVSNAEIAEIAKDPQAGAKLWYDSASDSNMMTYHGNNWVAYMGDAVRESRTKRYRELNMAGTTNWAVDLDRFHDAPGVPAADGGPPVASAGWPTLKSNIKQKGIVNVCDLEARTGDWVRHECTELEATQPTRFTAKDRWDSLDCKSAWNDAKLRWKTCDEPARNGSFSQSVAQFFHATEGAQCQNLATVNTCQPSEHCVAHHSSFDRKEEWTGAGAHLVWNSLARVHSLIRNYRDSLERAAIQIKDKKLEFLDTFAPTGHKIEDSLGMQILLILLSIPSTTLGTVFWKSGMKNLDFFASSAKLDAYKDTSQAIVMASFQIGRVFVERETAKEVSFNYIYDNLIGAWTDQLDTLTVALFDGSDEQLRNLDAIMGDGAMVSGSRNGQMLPAGTVPDNHTAAFLEQQAAQRAFYAAAIPSVWKMRKPYEMYPVILDFDADCDRDIGSGKFFHGGEDFNQGWICLDGHNYILAGTYDRRNKGPNCSPEYYHWCNNPDANWQPLFTLPGLKEIRDKNKKFGDVTVEDLVAGSVATWLHNDKKNLFMDKDRGMVIDPANRAEFDDMWDNDIRAPGAIRIPVCSVKEAYWLAILGLGKGIPEEDLPAFPCLRDPAKMYEIIEEDDDDGPLIGS